MIGHEGDWDVYDWSVQVRKTEVDGRSLRFVDLGEGPPVLLLHGTGGSWTTWLLNLRELAVHHRVIAPDIPGFGASEPPGPSDDLTPYADALAALLDHLSRRASAATPFAGLMIAAGVDIKAQVFMGHASITVTTDRGGHLIERGSRAPGRLFIRRAE